MTLDVWTATAWNIVPRRDDRHPSGDRGRFGEGIVHNASPAPALNVGATDIGTAAATDGITASAMDAAADRFRRLAR